MYIRERNVRHGRVGFTASSPQGWKTMGMIVVS